MTWVQKSEINILYNNRDPFSQNKYQSDIYNGNDGQLSMSHNYNKSLGKAGNDIIKTNALNITPETYIPDSSTKRGNTNHSNFHNGNVQASFETGNVNKSTVKNNVKNNNDAIDDMLAEFNW